MMELAKNEKCTFKNRFQSVSCMFCRILRSYLWSGRLFLGGGLGLRAPAHSNFCPFQLLPIPTHRKPGQIKVNIYLVSISNLHFVEKLPWVLHETYWIDLLLVVGVTQCGCVVCVIFYDKWKLTQSHKNG